jgi:hypothetical protein
VWPHRRALRAAVRSAGIALASAVGGFALSTPYFFLDWHTAMHDLRVEDAQPGPRDLSPLGNLRWYLATAIPEALTWPLVVLAFAGVVLAVGRPRARRILLVAFCAVFLACVCASKLHWVRWIIPILPVLVLFAASAVVTVAQRLATALPHASRRSIFVPATLIAVTAVLIIHPVGELLATNRRDNDGTSVSSPTRSAARDWIVTNVPQGSRILGDSHTVALHGTRFDVDHGLNASAHTLADYQRSGYQYLIVNGWDVALYRFNSAYHPHEARFYLDVACRTRLIATFPRRAQRSGHALGHGGWPVHIYQLDEPPRRLFGYLCAQRVGD